jgi:hypothetical protein
MQTHLFWPLQVVRKCLCWCYYSTKAKVFEGESISLNVVCIACTHQQTSNRIRLKVAQLLVHTRNCYLVGSTVTLSAWSTICAECFTALFWFTLKTGNKTNNCFPWVKESLADPTSVLWLWEAPISEYCFLREEFSATLNFRLPIVHYITLLEK